MSQKIIDLSIAIEAGLPSDPEMMIPRIDYVTHAQGAEQMEQFFPGLKKEQLPKSLGWAIEFLHLTILIPSNFHFYRRPDNVKVDKEEERYCQIGYKAILHHLNL